MKRWFRGRGGFFAGAWFARTVALEGGHNVQCGAVGGMTGLDGASVNHHGGPVQAGHGHQGARHVLVATGEGDVAIVPLRAHHL
eukprot:511457-Prorocentrum_minimum.AAC.3